jgi:hypothetical protein
MAHQEERRLGVNLEQPVEQVRIGIGHRGAIGGAGGVDQTIHPSEARNAGVYNGPGRRVVREIRVQEVGGGSPRRLPRRGAGR